MKTIRNNLTKLIIYRAVATTEDAEVMFLQFGDFVMLGEFEKCTHCTNFVKLILVF